MSTPIQPVRGDVHVFVSNDGGATWTPFTGAGAGGTSSNFGAAFPAAGTAVGFKDNGGNMAAGLLDGSGFLKVNVAAGGAGGGAVTVADGADVTQGAIADAAVTGDNTGTVSAKLRGLSKILADVWSSGSHWLQVSIQNATLAVTQSGTWTTNATKPATSTLSNVADNAASVTVLASNAARLGATFYNDSSSAVRLKFGTTASATSFTKRLLPNDYWDVTPTGYTGKVDAIWDSAPGGAMRVTELTA